MVLFSTNQTAVVRNNIIIEKQQFGLRFLLPSTQTPSLPCSVPLLSILLFPLTYMCLLLLVTFTFTVTVTVSYAVMSPVRP
jgi:hypothetical protein